MLLLCLQRFLKVTLSIPIILGDMGIGKYLPIYQGGEA